MPSDEGGVRAFFLLSYASGFEQTASIAVLRMAQDFFYSSLLAAYSLVHDKERVTKLLHERDVMTDEEKRKPVLFF